MRVLVVHDRDEVATEVVKIAVRAGARSEDVLTAVDGVTARAALKTNLFDLAIVDLTLPHIRGVSDADYTIAEELFQELFHTEELNIPGDLIGLTRDMDALGKINSAVGPHLMAIIEERDDGQWRKLLEDRIAYVDKTSRSRQASFNRHYEYDVAIITALDEEIAPFSDIFEQMPLRQLPGAREFLFTDAQGSMRRGLAYSIGRSGQAPAAAMTEAIVTQFRPSLVVMSGFCGGFSSKAAIGDVLIAESVFDWDYGKWKGDGADAVFVPRPEPIVIRDSVAHQIAREFLQDYSALAKAVVGNAVKISGGRVSGLKMSMGPIASGSSVVAEASIIKRIQGLNENILGVDMEAYGFFYANRYAPVIKPEFLFVKSVADYADRKKGDDEDHPVCCYLAAKVVEEIIKRRWKFVRPLRALSD